MATEIIHWLKEKKREYLEYARDGEVSKIFLTAKIDLLNEVIAKVHELNNIEENKPQ